MRNNSPKPPIVYSCSGCSNAAQLANHLALELDACGEAEMSCIAGVGGKVPALLKIARSGRPILALDGCVLACVRATLACAGVTADRHIRLDLLGVRKLKKTSFDRAQAADLLPDLVCAARDLAGAAPGTPKSGSGSAGEMPGMSHPATGAPGSALETPQTSR